MTDTETTLQELLKVTSKLAGQVESIDKRMDKIENVVTNDVRQDQRIEAIEVSLRRGNDKFQKIEERLNNLEDADGNKAKGLVHVIGNYALTAILAFIAAAISFYLGGTK